MRMSENRNVLEFIKENKSTKVRIAAIFTAIITFLSLLYWLIDFTFLFNFKLIAADYVFIGIYSILIPFLIFHIICFFILNKLMQHSVRVRSAIQDYSKLFVFYFEYVQSMNGLFIFYATFFAYIKFKT